MHSLLLLSYRDFIGFSKLFYIRSSKQHKLLVLKHNFTQSRTLLYKKKVYQLVSESINVLMVVYTQIEKSLSTKKSTVSINIPGGNMFVILIIGKLLKVLFTVVFFYQNWIICVRCVEDDTYQIQSKLVHHIGYLSMMLVFWR